MKNIDLSFINNPIDNSIPTYNKITSHELSIIDYFIKPNINTYLEIGTFTGGTTHYLARKHKNVLFFTLSITREIHNEINTGQPDHKEDIIPQAEIGKLCKEDNNVIQIYGDSLNSQSWSILPNQIDMVFIDGCHLSKYVKQDSINAYIRNPEVIIWHDTKSIGGVVKAIESFENAYQEVIYNINTKLGLGIWVKNANTLHLDR